ncbi:MAG: hypothetical protein U0Q18_11540 [Bryobacteraceae bacterium]
MSRKSTHGGVLGGLLLTILILSALGFAALVATGLFVFHHVRFKETAAAGGMTLETPFGSVRIRDRNAEFHRLGLPVYPGSVREKDPKMASLEVDFGERHHGIRLRAAEYRTSDSVGKVTEYYRHRFPHWLLSEREHGIRLEFTEGGYRQIVAIRDDDGETRIGLASVGDGASN